MTLNCNGTLIDISSPKVMGILNITPDSFYDGGSYTNEKEILVQTEKMLKEGATFIDVGAYSSRPGANHISLEEELERILPVIKMILNHFPETLLSIDTFRSEIAKQCVDNGACIINDISAGKLDENMFATVASLQVPYIMMHLKGTPQTMKKHMDYDNLLKEILKYFSERVSIAHSHKIKDLIIDPGFGFSKTIKQNFQLLDNLELLSILEKPLLVGLSRKSMIYKTLESTVQDALNGTSSVNTIALLKGAKILRVHDVKEAMECIKLTSQLKS